MGTSRTAPERRPSLVASGILTIAVVAFAVGFVVYLTGNEVAALLMIAAFGVFVFGVGALVATSE